MSGLLRIILIDTHLPGLVELKLDGHTNICGTNASGKTTLQRLIPVFYGELPSRVVPATRDSFERWYLPRESSYLIYEYQRANGEVCQALLTSSGTGVTYRLVARPFVVGDYVRPRLDGSSDCIPSSQIGREFKALNALVTRQLNTSEYRAILQNDRTAMSGLANGRELTGLARQFSLGESGVSLRHIEKLARAVHSREGKMETIKAMVASILEEDGVVPPEHRLGRQAVETWISECQLIQGFERMRPQFRVLEDTYARLQQEEARLAQLARVFEQDQDTLAGQRIRLEGDCESGRIRLKQIDTKWKSQQDALNADLSVADGQSKSLEAELENIEASYQTWLDQDIEARQEDLRQLPDWQADLKGLEAQYQLITAQHQDAEAACNRQKLELQERYEAEGDRLLAQNEQLTSDRHAQSLAKQAEMQTLAHDAGTGAERLKADYQKRVQTLLNEQSALEASLSAVSLSVDELANLDLLDHQINEAMSAEEAAQLQLNRAEQTRNEAQKSCAEADKQLARDAQALERREKTVRELEALLYPGDKTLLAVLRRDKPDWVGHIARVIRPDLLQRQDLKPVVQADSQTSFYGLGLDLNVIPLPDFAVDEHGLRAQLQQAEEALRVAREQHAQAEKGLARAYEVLSAQETQRTQRLTDSRVCREARQRLREEKEALQREYNQRIQTRRQGWQERLEVARQSQRRLESSLQDDLKQQAHEQSQIRLEREAHWQLILGDLDHLVTQNRQRREQLRQSIERERQQCDQWLRDELARRGVDVDEISRLKSALATLRQSIARAEASREKVRDFEYWYQQQYLQRKSEAQKALLAARQQQAECKRAFDAARSTFQEERRTAESEQAERERTLTETRRQEEDVRALLQTIKALRLGPATEDAPPASLTQRLSESRDLLDNRDTLMTQVREGVNHFDRLLAEQSGTGLAETWDHARERCSVVNSAGLRSLDHRRMVPHLEQLLNIIVPQKLRGLREQGRIFGADLISFFQVLQNNDRSIVTQSQRITREVEQELFLDGVSDSAVSIRSRITELEFWPELKRFEQLYEGWKDTGMDVLPDDDYANCMRQVIDILGRSTFSGSIGALLDIELKIREGQSDLLIRTDRQLNESSSHGMAYLILCKFLLAFTRLLRGGSGVTIHWPIDELGTLHQSNVKKIFDACQHNQITVVGAFPNPDSEVLQLFHNRYLIDKTSKRLKTVQPRLSPIAERLKAQQRQTPSTLEDTHA